MEFEIEGIVLRQISYKEKDAIVSILTSKGVTGFYARGILSLTSKNASSCHLFTKSAFLLSSTGDKIYLRKGSILTSYRNLYLSIENMTTVSFMAEIVFKTLNEDDGRIYNTFERILELLNEKFDPLTLFAIFLAKVITYSGYSLNYSSCVLCANKRSIVQIDYQIGGFICKKCAQKQILEDSLYLKTFRYIFKVDSKDYNKVVLNKKILLRLIHELLNYLKDKLSLYKFVNEEIFFEILNK